MKPRDHWFRSSDWDTAAQAEFERRLARAQPSNRVQYRRVKALALLHGGDQGAQLAGYEMLTGLVRDGDAPNMEKVSALSEMARFDQDRGRLNDAERNYRVALAAMRSNRSGSNGEEEIRLAEILIDRGDSSNLDEARQLLEQRAQDPPLFLSGRFRLAVATVRLMLALDETSAAADWASKALAFAAAQDSGLRWHPTLGLVNADGSTLKWLQRVASGRPRKRIF